MEKFSDKTTPIEFPFPFTPYHIQRDFMETLYSVIEKGKLGIFESPTGTGKSLSIICSCMKWLKDHNEQEKDSLFKSITELEKKKQEYSNEDTDWFSVQSKKLEITHELNKLKIEEKKILDYEEKIENIKKNRIKYSKKTFKNPKENEAKNLQKEENDLNIEDTDILLVEADNNVTDEIVENEEMDESKTFHPTQIIIASRTHSQLSQFIGEIKKLKNYENIRVASLASRQNYCINSSVNNLKNLTLINEKCVDMQKKNSTAKDNDGKITKKKRNTQCQCPHYKPSNIEDLKNIALTEILDIEDLVQIGKNINACPYYASRKAAEDAEILLVPYNTLLHKATREANGVRIKNNVIIIDEAHNLLESLAQMYGSDLNYPQLFYSLEYLKFYKQRFNKMFSAVTLRYLNQLIFVVNKLEQLFAKDLKEDTTQIYSLEDFVLTSSIDQYNFFDLVKFCKSSKIAQKVRSYSIKYSIEEEMMKNISTRKKGVKDFLQSISTNKAPSKEETRVELPKFPAPNNPLLAIISFLESLTYSYEDGRILLTHSSDKANCKLQFLLLNPTSNFTEIIKEARSVIVAGGTMKPISEFRNRLFINSGAESERIREFSCNHIIPSENILPIAVTNGLNQEQLLFNYTNRKPMINSLMGLLKKTCEVIPGGIVVFFPSYNYENLVYEQIKSKNLGRPLFREPQKSNSVEIILEKYSSTIKKSKNAILFSVVGGKLSEGLNFSDDLGRCIIVVGLPYANIMAADLKEKMSFLDKNEGNGSGKIFYENLCMKAVNQCIGRAVRHKNDYATILLLDERYGKHIINNALPNWIKGSLKISNSQEAFKNIKKVLFFFFLVVISK